MLRQWHEADFALPEGLDSSKNGWKSTQAASPSKGFRLSLSHTSILLTAKMVEYLGDKTGGWMTTITYDPASITADNLKQYDAIFLGSTTGAFLDEPHDEAATQPKGVVPLEGWERGPAVSPLCSTRYVSIRFVFFSVTTRKDPSGVNPT